MSLHKKKALNQRKPKSCCFWSHKSPAKCPCCFQYTQWLASSSGGSVTVLTAWIWSNMAFFPGGVALKGYSWNPMISCFVFQATSRVTRPKMVCLFPTRTAAQRRCIFLFCLKLGDVHELFEDVGTARTRVIEIEVSNGILPEYPTMSFFQCVFMFFFSDRKPEWFRANVCWFISKG